MMMSLPDVTCKIRFKIPFYYRKSWICYLNPVKGNGVEFVFLRGNELSNEQGLLEAKGRKQVSGVTFYEIKEIPQEVLQEVVMEALILDDEVKYKSKRSKKDESP
jgi:hypothetical protein